MPLNENLKLAAVLLLIMAEQADNKVAEADKAIAETKARILGKEV